MGRRGYPPEFRRKVLELANTIFEYLEVWHSWLDMLTPIEYERTRLTAA